MLKTLHDLPSVHDNPHMPIRVTREEQIREGLLYHIDTKYKWDDAVSVLTTIHGEWYVGVSTPFGMVFVKPYTKKHQALAQYVRDYVEAQVLIVEAQKECGI